MLKNIIGLNRHDSLEHLKLAAHVAEYAEWDNRAHLERIRLYTYTLAVETGIEHSQAELISIAAVLHDIGKVTIPASILRKTANLTPDEYKIAERHTVEGARLLSGSDSQIFQTAEIIAKTHHERWDGSGYPNGLQGNNIPLSGRIVAMADVFDALTTRRPYKKEMNLDAALDLIRTSSGSLFDPGLTLIFLRKQDVLLKILSSNN